MPLYFFDTIDGAGLIRDETGFELADDEAARRHGIDALPDMARNELPDGDLRAFTIIVRDLDKTAIYIADLTLCGRWLR